MAVPEKVLVNVATGKEARSNLTQSELAQQVKDKEAGDIQLAREAAVEQKRTDAIATLKAQGSAESQAILDLLGVG